MRNLYPGCTEICAIFILYRRKDLVTKAINEPTNPFLISAEERDQKIEARKAALLERQEERDRMIQHWLTEAATYLELDYIFPDDLDNGITVLFPDVSTGLGGKNIRFWLDALQQKMNDDFEMYHDEKYRTEDGEQYKVPIKSYGSGVIDKDRRHLNSGLSKSHDLCMVDEDKFCMGVVAPPSGTFAFRFMSGSRELSKVTRNIKYEGSLIFITPRSSLEDSSTTLALYYNNLQIFALPDKEYNDPNNLVLVMGSKGARSFAELKERADSIVAFAKDANRTSLTTGMAFSEDFTRTVTEGDGKPIQFRSYLIDRSLAITEAARNGFMGPAAWEKVLEIESPSDEFQPQNPLTLGHLSWLTSSGSTSESGLRLEKIDEDGITTERQFFRGSAKKKEDISRDKVNNTEIRLERLDAKAITLNLDTWSWDTKVELSPFIQKWRKEMADHMTEFMAPHFTPDKFGKIAHRYKELLRPPLHGIGQRLSVESLIDTFTHESKVIMVGEPGLGKTFISLAVGHMLGTKATAIVCPVGIVRKWYREIMDTIPGAQAFIIGKLPPKDVPRLTDDKHPVLQLEQIRRIADPKRPLFIILPSSSAKLGYSHLPAVVWRYASKPKTDTYEIDEEGIRNPVGNLKMTRHLVPDREERGLFVRANKKLMCCPECLQPITTPRGIPQTWEWLASGKRICVNDVKSEKFKTSERNKTFSRFDLGQRHGDGELKVTEAQIKLMLPILQHEDAHIASIEVFTNHVNVNYEVLIYAPQQCDAPLWQAKSTQPEILTRYAWDKVMAEYPAEFIREYRRDQSLPDMERPIEHLVEDIRIERDVRDNLENVVGLKSRGINKIPLCKYIAKKMPGWLDFLIADELHTYSADDSLQGELVGRLANIIPRSLGLTGTLMNGTSSNLFRLLWRLSSRIRKLYGYYESGRWVDEHGFRQRTISYKRKEARNVVGRRVNAQEAKMIIDKQKRDEVPGIMPTALPMLLPNSVFMRLEDVVEGLPPFQEFNIGVELDDRENGNAEGFSQRQAYNHLRDNLKVSIGTMMRRNGAEGARMMGTYLQGLLSYPDGCVNLNANVVTDIQGEDIFRMEPMREDWVYPKEQTLLDLVAESKEQGRRVLVYAIHTGTRDITARVQEMLQNEGNNALILHKNTVDADKRIEWIEEKIDDGMEVMITHPGNVSMGHDLRWFPTIIWLEPDYETNRVRQASRRSWRIGQTEPVKVYYLTYNQTMQTRALKLVAQKVATSLAVEGELPTDGLAALSPSRSIEMELAKALVQDENLVEEDKTFTGLIQLAVQTNAEADQLLIEGGQDAYLNAIKDAIDEDVKADSVLLDVELKSTMEEDQEGKFVDHTILVPVATETPEKTKLTVVDGEQSVSDWLAAFSMTEADLANNGKKSRRRRRR